MKKIVYIILFLLIVCFLIIIFSNNKNNNYIFNDNELSIYNNLDSNEKKHFNSLNNIEKDIYFSNKTNNINDYAYKILNCVSDLNKNNSCNYDKVIGYNIPILLNNDLHYIRVSNLSNNKSNSETSNGIVIEFSDIISLHKVNDIKSSTGGWEKSSIRKYINNDIYNLIPDNIKELIIDTKVISSHNAIDKNNFVTYDKLYLLSTEEIYKDGNKFDSSINNSNQLDYYKYLKIDSKNYTNTIKYYNNDKYSWWLRSSDSFFSNYFYSVHTLGVYVTDYTDKEFGVSPAFRIK